MILYDYRCLACEVRVELAVASMAAPTPECPGCGEQALRRVPSRVRIGGADTGPARDRMPRSWQATGGGDRETVARWHEKAVAREKLEERHPEIAGDRRPVLAHEGRFAANPLRAGDPLPGGDQASG